MIFKQMVNQMLGTSIETTRPIWISQEEYDQWKQQYLFRALKGCTVGRDFCDHFGIQDYILYFSSADEADTYIKRVYIQ
jgi:hypothetical protein